jgi:hypothetical protein
MKSTRWFLILAGLGFILCSCGSNNNSSNNTPSSPAPLCSNPSQSGVTTAGSGKLALGAGTIFAQPVTLTTSTTVISLSVYLTGLNTSTPNSGEAWAALYDDNGSNAPGNLLVASNPQNVVNGWNTFNVTNIATSFLVTKYWEAFQFSNSSNFGPDNSSGGMLSAAYTWGVFPSSLPSMSSVGLNVEAYVSTCP